MDRIANAITEPKGHGEIEITPEMIKAGIEEFEAYRAELSDPSEEAVLAIFRAMVEASPLPLRLGRQRGLAG
jgi:hypothetical protein